MTQGLRLDLVRGIVAAEVIIGHIVVFLVAFFGLGILVFSLNADTAQIVLMVSPVLAATSASAVRNLLHHKSPKQALTKVNLGFATYVILMPLVLVGVLLALFWIAYQQVNGFGPEALKISLGVVEAFFGLYLGGIAESLFGTAPNKAA